jgi:multidrug efflux pump subunit AcrA (membrane-fusion protein)
MTINDNPVIQQTTAFQNIYLINKKSNIRKWFWMILLVLAIILLLPWTQNIRATGSVTTLRQEQRPQEVNTIIGGSVVKWFIKEGDYVKAGDTILQLTEVKVEYFDPQLVNRTQEQINAKRQSINEYNNKVGAIQSQMTALDEGRNLKLQSLQNKIQQQELKINIEEADLNASKNELSVYKRQLEGGDIMLKNGSIPLVEYEKRKVNYQNGLAKVNSYNNKLMQARQELINLRIEQNGAIQEYNDKIAKADGEKFSALSNAASTNADVSKLQNQLSNYEQRNKLYYITAPQSGQITKAKKAGIGEILKDGEMVVEIVPDHMDYAVEMYIDPMDLPLIQKGQKVRFVFDGFPAIVFSGWPTGSYGTFGGVVTAIETAVSPNGKFRILVAEDPKDRKWPKQLRMGNGAQGIALLKDVFIFYELWRNINGFPPEFYKPNTNTKDADKK